MNHLLSLPPNLVKHFHRIAKVSPDNWFCTCDPQGARVGSGGGTVWLLDSAWRANADNESFEDWLKQEKRVLLHAGGQGRRIPAYAPSGKILTPIPLSHKRRGERFCQNLLEMQMPLYEHILQRAPKDLHTLIVSGDVMIKAQGIGQIPECDVVCFGLPEDASLAKNHGVFMIDRAQGGELDFMLQKPSVETLERLSPTHDFLMDIGIWLLSDRAVSRLRQLCTGEDGSIKNYDLYGDFGPALGRHPSKPEPLLEDLSVSIISLEGGEFLHYGTSRELLSSTQKQMAWEQGRSIFVQNSTLEVAIGSNYSDIWIENSFVSKRWTLSGRNIITGVPQNQWTLTLKGGQCIDVIPIDENEYALRPYGFEDAFRGALDDRQTTLLGQSFEQWMLKRGVGLEDFCHIQDIQTSELFPVSNDIEQLGRWAEWFVADEPDLSQTQTWRQARRISADSISDCANLERLDAQRQMLYRKELGALAKNWQDGLFHQLDLKDLALKFKSLDLELPQALPQDVPLMTRIHDAMFRSQYLETGAEAGEWTDRAFSLLSEGIVEGALEQKTEPQLSVAADQIVWASSPVRIDLAGGWSDTPPYSLLEGGNVVNMAICLNGQLPIQVYVRPNKDYNIVCRSIDLGAVETISTFQEIEVFNKVGSPFSIPKAALALAGFLPRFSKTNYSSLRRQLEDFGAGLDITLLAAIPAGSGLGTSSILAATLLAALSDFCHLGWDKREVCSRTLVLEQLLTTGGGWQDQYGGVLGGIKLLQSQPGFLQQITATALPEELFKGEQGACHLLYYTGITRTAKHILADIVRGMFLNEQQRLGILEELKQHALAMQEAIKHGDFSAYGKLLRRSWELNCRLDQGTAPEKVQHLCSMIDDMCFGYKLPGAGGGGYMYMLAKDSEAAQRLRQKLSANPIAPTARWVELSLSDSGLQLSRS